MEKLYNEFNEKIKSIDIIDKLNNQFNYEERLKVVDEYIEKFYKFPENEIRNNFIVKLIKIRSILIKHINKVKNNNEIINRANKPLNGFGEILNKVFNKRGN